MQGGSLCGNLPAVGSCHIRKLLPCPAPQLHGVTCSRPKASSCCRTTAALAVCVGLHLEAGKLSAIGCLYVQCSRGTQQAKAGPAAAAPPRWQMGTTALPVRSPHRCQPRSHYNSAAAHPQQAPALGSPLAPGRLTQPAPPECGAPAPSGQMCLRQRPSRACSGGKERLARRGPPHGPAALLRPGRCV